MSRLPFFLAFLMVAACAPEPPTPEVRVSRWRDMTVESRSLPADTTFAAVGLRPEAAHDDGSTDWSSSATDRIMESKEGFVRREYRLTVANRGSIAREFHARVDYYAPTGELLRRRKIEHMVVPPFTENTWIGSAMLREPGEGELLVRVVPSSEELEAPGEGDRSG